MNNEKLSTMSYQNSINSPTPLFGETKRLSDEVVSIYLNQLVGIIDERIERRLKDNEDVAICYTAEIINRHYTTVANNGNETRILSGITVRYNDEDYVSIYNDSINILSDTADAKWIKICTYDGVNYYVLHKL